MIRGRGAPVRMGLMPSAPTLEFVFEVIATLAPPLEIGRTAQGERRIIPIAGGTFAGPGINGRVLPVGADWQLIRPDGVTELDARYTVETSAGALICVSNRGIRHGPP